MHRGCATQSHRGHATRAPAPRTPSPPHAAHLRRGANAPEADGASEMESPSTVTTRLSSSSESSRSFPSAKDPPTDRLSASMSPTATSTCSGGASHLSLASFAYSGLRKCTRRGRLFHGETCSIAMTSLVLFTSELDLSLTLSSAAASLTARLSAGFCHAHSNCIAWTFDGNPCTRRTISHGRSLRVYLAPAASTPLCCLMRRSGLTVKPT
mmetsp:Transcript_931/g.3830  ORF Transcript_931/g.3830 Transcript_931/m.3830 type:complete len:211 (-) Transcript_931:111-743(-)